jgi:myo-inositol-1-phosphate synthase
MADSSTRSAATARDLEFVLAIDTDARKVGLDLAEAIFAPPNCTSVFARDIPPTGVAVMMGRVLDGMAEHMLESRQRGFVRARRIPRRTRPRSSPRSRHRRPSAGQLPAGRLRGGGAVLHGLRARGRRRGGQLHSGVHRQRPGWERRFAEKRLPIVGDDIKAQLGATIVHRVLSNLFRQRGVEVSRPTSSTPAATPTS